MDDFARSWNRSECVYLIRSWRTIGGTQTAKRWATPDNLPSMPNGARYAGDGAEMAFAQRKPRHSTEPVRTPNRRQRLQPAIRYEASSRAPISVVPRNASQATFSAFPGNRGRAPRGLSPSVPGAMAHQKRVRRMKARPRERTSGGPKPHLTRRASFDVALLSSAPKGHSQISPGHRPGDEPVNHASPSPERAQQRHWVPAGPLIGWVFHEHCDIARGGPSIVAPFQGWRMVEIPLPQGVAYSPRAMPWADLSGPFRARSKMRNTKTRERGSPVSTRRRDALGGRVGLVFSRPDCV